jgi:8-oxo-dGTP diphosphatase
VDCVVFGVDSGDLKVLLIKRGTDTFAGSWALPGGFVNIDESVDDAAVRELEEETGLKGVFLEQLYTFGSVKRDPRGRVVTVAYYALVKSTYYLPEGGSDATDAAWFSVNREFSLPFDHNIILGTAIQRLKGKIRYAPIGFELLPEEFPLSELRHIYEAILERDIDKRNFRKKVLATGLLIDTGKKQQDVAHRAAKLYRFDRAAYVKMQLNGFNFEL